MDQYLNTPWINMDPTWSFETDFTLGYGYFDLFVVIPYGMFGSYSINPKIRIAAKFNILMISEFLVVLSRGKIWIAKIHLNLRDVFTDPRCCALVLQAHRAWRSWWPLPEGKGSLVEPCAFFWGKKNTGFSGDGELVQQGIAGHSWSSIMGLVVLSSIVHLSIRYIGCFI